ncbi:taste 1 receptor member 3 [Ictidomys tridecemlineatus]|uniref:taste receptor type 1 member 3 n=1 Tax=Ictidomys tridecemlineatus TaxID=43179 RepID=UPI00025DD290|nr:taste receptor type 1 member 3 [Ictidomys tridecemlineatus]KAG3281889.1 taste 1 receptor member 3 [Ictidomys tridecemlineatus]
MPGLAVLGLLLAALLGLGTGTSLCLSRQLRMQGDYMLGGLFPLGSAEEASLRHRTRPSGIVCTRFSSLGLFLAMAVKMAVEEINNSSTLLPGLHLGYDLFDTCSEPMVTMKPSLMFLAEAGNSSIAAYCNYTQYQPRVLAVIGPHSSELALITGKFFSFFLMPQVSYGASMDRLSNRDTFPSFFRTVPSDRVQLEAVVKLLQKFEWNWVAALGSDDEYGREGLSIFSGLANAQNICIAHEGLVPLLGADTLKLDKVLDVLRQVNQSNVQVVVLFASSRAAHALLHYSIHHNLSPKVWVASEAWLTSDLVMTLPGIAQVGTVLGFLQRGVQLPEFSQYVEMQLALASDPAFCASLDDKPDLEEHVVGPRCPQCDHITLRNLSTGLLQNLSAGQLHHQIFATYAAVYSVAQALHNTLQCSPTSCPAREPVRPWQLLENMYNMSFRARGLALQFDSKGNVDMEYDLKMWVWQKPTPRLHTVGTFNGSLWLQPSQMHWHMPGNQVPASQCSRQCEEGQVRRVKGFHSCCYDCVDCKAGNYRQSLDDFVCTPCGQDQWSPERSTRCFPRRPRFLAWGEPAVLLLLLLLSLVLGLTLAALGLFACHWDSPLVQASGGPLACFGLACLGLVCLSVLLFPGRPGPASCLAQQPLAHLPLTGCLSTLFLKAAETFVESELPPNWATRLHGCLRGPWAWLVVLLAILTEAVLCAWYLVAFTPEVMTDWRVLPTEALVHCHMRSWVSLGLVHITNALLAFLCFLGTFLVQSQPGRYNHARGLTFAMLAYFITWVSFVPLLTNVQVVYQPAVQMGAILLCALGILAAFHLPKCYLLLWWPRLNTPEFFLGAGPGDARDRGRSGSSEGPQGNEGPFTPHPHT